MTSQKTFLHFSNLDTMYLWSMMKNIHSPNLVRIGSWGPEIWPREYLISPNEISVNWPTWFQMVMNQANLHWFQWGYLGIHAAISRSTIKPIHVKFGVWGFFIMFFWNIVMKMLKCKKENLMTWHFSTLSQHKFMARDNIICNSKQDKSKKVYLGGFRSYPFIKCTRIKHIKLAFALATRKFPLISFLKVKLYIFICWCKWPSFELF